MGLPHSWKQRPIETKVVSTDLRVQKHYLQPTVALKINDHNGHQGLEQSIPTDKPGPAPSLDSSRPVFAVRFLYWATSLPSVSKPPFFPLSLFLSLLSIQPKWQNGQYDSGPSKEEEREEEEWRQNKIPKFQTPVQEITNVLCIIIGNLKLYTYLFQLFFQCQG